MELAPKKLLSILISRGRPARLLEAVESFLSTRTGVADMLVVLDDDDPTLDDSTARLHGLDVRVKIGPRLGLAQTFNRECVIEAHQYDVLGLSADDVIFRTVGWDQRFYSTLLEYRFAGVVYGDDKIQGKKLCTHPYFGSVIPRALGRVLPPEQKHLYIDNNFMRLGRLLNCLQYIPDVVTEHRHSSRFPEYQDQGYAAVNSREVYSHDFAVHTKWTWTMETDARLILDLAHES